MCFIQYSDNFNNPPSPYKYLSTEHSGLYSDSPIQVTPVPDLCLSAVQLSHNVTGADVLHRARDDSNNLFRYEGHVQNKAIHLVFETSCGGRNHPSASGSRPLWHDDRWRLCLSCSAAPRMFDVCSAQRSIPHDAEGQHRGAARPGAHGALLLVSLPRPLLQHTEPLPGHLHECLHRSCHRHATT